MKRLFTIGHSNHSIEHFLELLSAHQISSIADVRSSPYSKYAPHFSKAPLEHALREATIDYTFLGQELGARRREEDCYVGERACYSRIAALPIFQRGLERLLEGVEDFNVSLLCSESDPMDCHRSILVCRELKRLCPEFEIRHVLGDGTDEGQEEFEERLIAHHKLQPELFGDLTTRSGLVEKAYDLQADKIAYRQSPAEA